jgi:hypothetical protein
MTELSSNPVDASLFEVPKDFASAPPADLIRGMLEAQLPGAPPAKP